MKRSWNVCFGVIAAVCVASANAQQVPEDPPINGGPGPIDACTQIAPPGCLGFVPDCSDMCGDPFTPGGAVCYAFDDIALWVCCPSGYDLQLDLTCTPAP